MGRGCPIGAVERAAPSVDGAAGVGAFGRGGAGFGVTAGAGAPAPPGNDSFNLRMTGASTVEDADRTNSPSSASLASTTLLSTPNSLASS